jgi:hypothetical protein
MQGRSRETAKFFPSLTITMDEFANIKLKFLHASASYSYFIKPEEAPEGELSAIQLLDIFIQTSVTNGDILKVTYWKQSSKMLRSSVLFQVIPYG